MVDNTIPITFQPSPLPLAPLGDYAADCVSRHSLRSSTTNPGQVWTLLGSRTIEKLHVETWKTPDAKRATESLLSAVLFWTVKIFASKCFLIFASKSATSFTWINAVYGNFDNLHTWIINTNTISLARVFRRHATARISSLTAKVTASFAIWFWSYISDSQLIENNEKDRYDR